MKKLLLLAAFLLSANSSVFSVNTGDTDRGDIHNDDASEIMGKIAVLEELLARERARLLENTTRDNMRERELEQEATRAKYGTNR